MLPKGNSTFQRSWKFVLTYLLAYSQVASSLLGSGETPRQWHRVFVNDDSIGSILTDNFHREFAGNRFQDTRFVINFPRSTSSRSTVGKLAGSHRNNATATS